MHKNNCHETPFLELYETHGDFFRWLSALRLSPILFQDPENDTTYINALTFTFRLRDYFRENTEQGIIFQKIVGEDQWKIILEKKGINIMKSFWCRLGLPTMSHNVPSLLETIGEKVHTIVSERKSQLITKP